MALVNAVLARWARGRVWVVDGASVAQWERHEGYLSVGAMQSEEDAMRAATAYLGTRAQPVVATTVGLEPRGNGDEPGVDFGVGDWVVAPDEDLAGTAQRVRALTLADVPNAVGQVMDVPELRHVSAERDDAVQRWLKRMANGALGGSAASASPAGEAKPPAESPPKEVPPFSLATVKVSTSERWLPPVAMRICWLVATLSTVGSGETVVKLYKNGSVMPASRGYGGQAAFRWAGVPGTQGLRLAVDLAVGDYIEMVVTAAGSGALNLIVQPTGV